MDTNHPPSGHGGAVPPSEGDSRLMKFLKNAVGVSEAPRPATPPPHRPPRPRSAPALPARQPLPPRSVLTTRGKHHPALDSGDACVRVMHLGGLEQVGRNMSAYFYKNDIVTIDCGLEFADSSMPGIDYIIPDTEVLEERKERIRAMIITHGHLDHIGALQHILPKLNFPQLITTRFTAGLIRERLSEYGMDKKVKIIEINPDEERKIKAGHFDIELFRVNHSIPDSTGVALHTPCGTIVHTGDYKFDLTPSDGQQCDFAKISRLGKQGVTLLLSESTNAEKPGSTISESVIGRNLEECITNAPGRVIIATFASLIGRMQYVIHATHQTGRTLFLSGRSMGKNIEMSERLGYLKIPRGLVKPLKEGALNATSPARTVILCTGSQGEEMSALTRIANGEHQTIRIQEGDTIIFSSSPIPGNELAVITIMERLLRMGAKVITNKHLDIHVSGHGNREDLKLMLTLMRPRFLSPVHGMLYMRTHHKDLAIKTGMSPHNIFLCDNGDILEVTPQREVRKSRHKLTMRSPVVDGGNIAGEGTSVIRERLLMQENGVVFVVFKADTHGKLIGEPTLVSKGFMYLKESEKLTHEITDAAKKAFQDAVARGAPDVKAIRQEVSRNLEYVIQQKTGREPLVTAFVVIA